MLREDCGMDGESALNIEVEGGKVLGFRKRNYNCLFPPLLELEGRYAEVPAPRPIRAWRFNTVMVRE